MIKEKFKELLENIIQQTDPKNDRVVLTDQYYILVIRYDEKEKVYYSYDIIVNDNIFDVDYREHYEKPEYFKELISSYDHHNEFTTIDGVLEYIFN